MPGSETALAIDPTNPLHIAGFTHDLSPATAMQIFYSIDGGQSWSHQSIDSGNFDSSTATTSV
jgi:hypothetical protein